MCLTEKYYHGVRCWCCMPELSMNSGWSHLEQHFSSMLQVFVLWKTWHVHLWSVAIYIIVMACCRTRAA